MPVVRDAAKDFIRPYVVRGDSVEAICEGHMGRCCAEYTVQIGGVVRWNNQTKQIAPDRIAVTMINGQEYFTTFSVAELYREIKDEIRNVNRPKQQTLW